MYVLREKIYQSYIFLIALNSLILLKIITILIITIHFNWMSKKPNILHLNYNNDYRDY